MANPQLRGADDDTTAALVQQYVSFADNEILPPACTWTFPTLGIMQYNKQVWGCGYVVEGRGYEVRDHGYGRVMRYVSRYGSVVT